MLPAPPLDSLPPVMAHRGLSARAPENTLAAVRAAHAAGCRWVELDVQLLGDGTPVIWHDARLNRCSHSRGRLADLDRQRARRVDAGSRFAPRFRGEPMASLEAMLALVETLGLGLNLEFKLHRGRDPAALVDTVLPLVERCLPPSRWLASSFDRRALHALRRHRPDPQRLRLGIIDKRLPRRWREEVRELDAFSLHLDWRRLREPQARAVAASPCRLVAYTVNQPRIARRLYAWGAASLISDDPPALIDIK